MHDRDGTTPNSEFTVTADDNCPLEATEEVYISGEYAVPILYKLNKKLNFEDFKGDEPKINCLVVFRVSPLKKAKVKKPACLIGLILLQKENKSWI